MPEIKVGDRVRVVFDGTVTYENDNGTFDVRVDVIEHLPVIEYLHASVLTVIPPAIVRDDVITDADTLDTLPHRSVVSTGGHVWVRYNLAWSTSAGTVASSRASAGVIDHGPATVLRVGE